MTIVSSGTISINSLVGEYGGSVPHSMNEYYRGGSLVANHSNNSGVPTSGQIQLDDFYGANNTSPAPTTYTYAMTSAQYGTSGVRGFSTPGSYGSLSNNPQSTAFAGGFNPTVVEWNTNTSIAKDGSSLTDINFLVSGHLANSGWTSFTVPGSLSSTGSGATFNRSAGNHSQISGGGTNTTRWNFSNIGWYFPNSGSGNITLTE